MRGSKSDTFRTLVSLHSALLSNFIKHGRAPLLSFSNYTWTRTRRNSKGLHFTFECPTELVVSIHSVTMKISFCFFTESFFFKKNPKCWEILNVIEEVATLIKLGPAYNEFGYNKQPAITSKFITCKEIPAIDIRGYTRFSEFWLFCRM